MEPMDVLDFAISRIGEPHKHHRHCVHNLSADEQRAAWRRRSTSDEMYDLVYGDAEPVVITPDEWEIE